LQLNKRCFEGKGWLHFVEKKVKVSAGYYMNDLLPKLVEDCYDFMTYWVTTSYFRSDSGKARRTLLRLHWQRLLVAKEPQPEPLDYHMAMGSYVGEFRQAESEAAERSRAESGAAGYLEWFIWWNNPWICSELSQATYGTHTLKLKADISKTHLLT